MIRERTAVRTDLRRALAKMAPVFCSRSNYGACQTIVGGERAITVEIVVNVVSYSATTGLTSGWPATQNVVAQRVRCTRYRIKGVPFTTRTRFSWNWELLQLLGILKAERRAAENDWGGAAGVCLAAFIRGVGRCVLRSQSLLRRQVSQRSRWRASC